MTPFIVVLFGSLATARPLARRLPGGLAWAARAAAAMVRAIVEW